MAAAPILAHHAASAASSRAEGPPGRHFNWPGGRMDGGSLPKTLTETEQLDWLQLIRSENVGPVTFHDLLARYGSAGRALEALPDLVGHAGGRAGGRRAVKLADRAACERELRALYKKGGRLIAWGEPAYPRPLAALADAPPLIAIRGRAELLTKVCVGMVGARNASANGRRFATRLAADLGAAGLVVVSGLARGIDTAAHEGALATGTVAVVAGGVDVVYPPENARLMDRIAEDGVVVAEQPLGLEPRARHFPYRNRIISGLSRALVVVEATPRSGSLITARLAAEQGREVLAVPGSPLDPRARGTNGLIRDGAGLVESVADVISAINSLEFQLIETISSTSRRRLSDAAPAAQIPDEEPASSGLESVAGLHDKVLGLLSFSPMPLDDLIRRAQVSPGTLAQILLELELAGRIERQAGGQISLVPSSD